SDTEPSSGIEPDPPEYETGARPSSHEGIGTTATDLGGWRLCAPATTRNESPASPMERPHLPAPAAWRFERRSALQGEARQDPRASNIAPASPASHVSSRPLCSNRLHLQKLSQ